MGANGDICSRALFVDNLHLKDDAQIKCATSEPPVVQTAWSCASKARGLCLEEDVLM